ncbi:MAG: MlaD family protein [Maricaulaceae bacterium]
MESKANYAMIGLFVIIAFMASLSFVVWLSGAQFDQKFDQYEVSFQGAVRGLTEGSEVRFNGLSVGEVTQLGLDPRDSNSVIATIQVIARTPVHTNSEAQLEPLGLTGLNYIQISGGSEEFPLMSELPGEGPFRIPGKMSQIDSLVEGGEDVIVGVQRALSRVNKLMDEDSIQDIQAILANVKQITENFRELDVDPELLNRVLVSFEQAGQNVSAAAIAVDVAAKDFDAMIVNDVQPIMARAQTSMDGVDQALADFSRFADGGAQLTTDSRDAINRLSNSGLVDIEETLDGMRTAVESLNTILSDLEKSPLGFLAGEEREVMELPQ